MISDISNEFIDRYFDEYLYKYIENTLRVSFYKILRKERYLNTKRG